MWRVTVMRANVGDKARIDGRTIDGLKGQVSEILEVRGPNGEPPYFVRFDSGHQAIVYPGPDTLLVER